MPLHATLRRMFVPLLSEEVVYTGGLDPAGGAIELSCWICPFLTEVLQPPALPGG